MLGPRPFYLPNTGVSHPLSAWPLLLSERRYLKFLVFEGMNDFGAFAVLRSIPAQGLAMVGEDKTLIYARDE